MNIQYISDIHLEFFHIQKVLRIARNIKPVGDILVLAGDIGIPTHLNNHYRIFLETIAPKFKKIFIIAGNHEYYGSSSISIVRKNIENICSEFSNITFLDNSMIEYEGYCWIGSTLWTNVDANPRKIMNDIVCISNFKPADYNKEHKIACDFLERVLSESVLPCVVITHHLPIVELIHPTFLVGPDSWDLNQWFAARLESLILHHKGKIKVWFYGHTHEYSIQTHYDIKFLCNPIGYSGENPVRHYHRHTNLQC